MAKPASVKEGRKCREQMYIWMLWLFSFFFFFFKKNAQFVLIISLGHDVWSVDTCFVQCVFKKRWKSTTSAPCVKNLKALFEETSHEEKWQAITSHLEVSQVTQVILKLVYKRPTAYMRKNFLSLSEIGYS